MARPNESSQNVVSGNSTWVEELHMPGEKRYHVDDLKVYVQRQEGESGMGALHISHGRRKTMQTVEPSIIEQ